VSQQVRSFIIHYQLRLPEMVHLNFTRQNSIVFMFYLMTWLQ